MKKLRFIAFALVAMTALVACHREDDIRLVFPEDLDPRAPYSGHYRMEVVIDSLGIDGSWIDNSSDSLLAAQGYLYVLRDNADEATLLIEGHVVRNSAVASDTVLYYDTRATFDEDGILVPERQTLILDGYTYYITYGQMELRNDTLVITTEEHDYASGHDIGVKKTIYGIK